MDWGAGHYERTAGQLLPAARVVVDAAAPAPGEHVVDVGCGTGNAALLTAERGARVTGVDPATRLLEVARADAAARGLDATFVEGTAEALPLADGEADAAVSVFGVIFAADPAAAAGDLARVVGPAGRVVLSLWIPEGPLVRAIGTAREAVAAATGEPAGGPPFPWHEREALAGLLEPHGFAVELTEHTLAFTGDSAEAYVDADFASHPLWLGWRAVLEPRGELDAVRERMVAILEAANEEPGAFQVSSRYVVATAQRG